MEHLALLRKSPLFREINEAEIQSLLSCLSARKQHYQKNEFVLQRGQSISSMGMVLTGAVHIIKEDFWGVRTIIGEASAGDFFGETYACLQSETVEVSVIAAEKTEILFLSVSHIMRVCSNACSFHNRLSQNLLAILAGKNLMLTKKMEHLSRRTTREKLLSYLSDVSLRSGSATFEIPFNRQQLADYLAVDRSAMSSELGKLRDEGILTFQKNKFHLEESLYEHHS